jgi:hypothetical protein
VIETAKKQLRERFRNRKLFTAADIAALLTTDDDVWSTLRAKRWLRRTGAGVKRGGRVITSLTRLRNHFPEVADMVLQVIDVD